MFWFDWDDLGTWENVWHRAPKDNEQNVLLKGQWKKIATQGCLVYSHQKKIATLGVSDLIIIEGPSGILICDRNRAQEVRQLASEKW